MGKKKTASTWTTVPTREQQRKPPAEKQKGQRQLQREIRAQEARRVREVEERREQDLAWLQWRNKTPSCTGYSCPQVGGIPSSSTSASVSGVNCQSSPGILLMVRSPAWRQSGTLDVKPFQTTSWGAGGPPLVQIRGSLEASTNFTSSFQHRTPCGWHQLLQRQASVITGGTKTATLRLRLKTEEKK